MPRVPLRLWIAPMMATLAVGVALAVPGEWVPRFTPAEEFVAHAAAFGTAAGLWVWARPRQVERVVVVAVVLAGVSEWAQSAVVPLRSGSVSDAAADLVGVGIGCVVARVVSRRTAHEQRPVGDDG